MRAHKSFSVVIRRLATKILKPTRVGRWAYPYIQAVWRKYVIPYRRHRLQKHGWECLNRLHQTLTSAGVIYHCDYGTLLGLVRDKEFIPHDDDIDITIPVTECQSPIDILKIFLSGGYQYLHGFLYEGERREFTVVDKTGITIDVFFPSLCDEKGKVYGYQPIWTPDVAYPSENANTMIRYVFTNSTDIVPMDIYGIVILIPANAEQVLASEYGSGWKVPDGAFSTVNDRSHEVLPNFAYRLSLNEFCNSKNKVL